jgi:BolA protein
MSKERAATIEQLLIAAFAPTELLVKDQSHLHAGHAGAQEGKGHFEVKIVSDKFAGQSRITRHRMVYDALGSFIDSDIHALKINAVSPSDR